jgi:hypothetical protein
MVDAKVEKVAVGSDADSLVKGVYKTGPREAELSGLGDEIKGRVSEAVVRKRLQPLEAFIQPTRPELSVSRRCAAAGQDGKAEIVHITLVWFRIA